MEVFKGLNPVNKTGLSDEALCFLGVAELTDFFKKGALSPVALLRAQAQRIEAMNSQYNCVVVRHYDSALAQAQESERRFREGTPRALEGITVAIKDEARVKDWRTTYGSLLCKDVPVEPEDDALATTIRAAGAVMHVQTNAPEFSCHVVTWNKLWGVTRNPWNLEIGPGGSSGGSAVAVAVGFATLATGSDMAGSIRIPAAMCGVYGFKAPYGRNASNLYAPHVSQGPLARTFSDLVHFQNAWAGPSPVDMTGISPKLEYPLADYGSLKGWRLAYDPLKSWGYAPDACVVQSMENAVAALRSRGAIVDEVDLGFKASELDMYLLSVFSTSLGALYLGLGDHPAVKDVPGVYTSYIYNLVSLIKGKIGPDHLLAVAMWISAKHKQIQQQLFRNGYRALVMATMLTPYIPADLSMSEEQAHIILNGEQKYIGAELRNWWFFPTWPWNLLYNYPVVNVPVGQAPNNVPLGMQIISDQFDDLSALQVAANFPNPLEKTRPHLKNKL